jgi:c-di-GMP-binding flagellar brake protein YcgR
MEVPVVDLPQVGTPMYLTAAQGVNYRSRLEAIDGQMLSLSAPLETTDTEPPRPGQLIDVYWAQLRARVIVPCRMVETGTEAPFRWIVEAVGAPQQSNRREYVRGGGGVPVRLASEPEATVVGRLLDISEGGLRCWVPEAPSIGAGDQLLASVPLGRHEVELTGAVHTVRDAYGEPGKHMILTFQTGERVARVIRQHVFAWEIEERRRFEQP